MMQHMLAFAVRPAVYAAGLSALLLCASTGCHRTEAEPKAVTKPLVAVKLAPPTPLDVKAAALGGPTWDKHWDVFIERSLPPAMLTRAVPRDVRRYCPAFYRMDETDKRAWWAYFFQAMAAAEAGLEPKANVRHTEPAVAVRDKVTGGTVHQEGLLQLTYEDAKRYGCDFDWQADRHLPARDANKTILNPERNLACGIRILNHQIIDAHKPLFSRTSYWSTLQPDTESFRVFAKQMTNPPQACQAQGANQHRTGEREIAKR